MTKAPISLQDLRRRIYIKAKAEPTWRFWGLYVHICKLSTLRESYLMAKANRGAAGVDGETFWSIEEKGIEAYLKQLQKELVERTYQPQKNRKVEIPKVGSAKKRVLSIPTIRDRIVQGALKLILEPIFEADFQPGSYGYRPKRTAHEAVDRVSRAIMQGKTRVIDLDLKSYFDNVRHDVLLGKVAQRVDDAEVMRVLCSIVKTTGRKGVPQGGVISPLLSNLYLNEVDRMLERAKQATRTGPYVNVEYARYADDLTVLVHGHREQDWVVGAVKKRLGEEFSKLRVEINEEKSRVVDLTKKESLSFLGFEYRRERSESGKFWARKTPKKEKRTALQRRLKEEFRKARSQPVERVVHKINPILRGWVNYFRVGNSARCFQYIRRWVERKIRRHLMRARGKPGHGWGRWSTEWIYQRTGLYDAYDVKWIEPRGKAAPASRSHNP
jgi:RNA-directed DNA polymerase